jgi:hypothetical protein
MKPVSLTATTQESEKPLKMVSAKKHNRNMTVKIKSKPDVSQPV